MPVLTRWNSWFNSVQYVNEFLDDIVHFFKEAELTGSDGNAGIKYFKMLTAREAQVIKIQAHHVTSACTTLVQFITFLEGTHYPTGHLVHSKVDDLCSKFTILGMYVGCTH